jgi:hypothetical protein
MIGYINVQDAPYYAKGDGVADDTIAITNAITASFPGDVLLFPSGTYLVSSTIKLLRSRTYLGTHRERSTIKQKNNSNLDAILASETWLSTTSLFADNPINISHLGIDGNASHQSSGTGIGIALLSFWNHVSDLEIQNTRGDGLLLTSVRQDGTEVINTPVESHLSRIDTRNCAGYSIHIYDSTPNNQSVTDGWIRDCIVQNPGLDGIKIDCGAGWVVDGCHLYGCPQNGIHIGRADGTRVTNNFIESYGNGATIGYYSAICLGDGITTYIGSSNPSIISNNTLFFSFAVTAGTQIYGISTNCSNGTTANINIHGNALLSNGLFTGINISNQGATSITNVLLSANVNLNWATALTTNANGGTITLL